jgi:single-strand DNA-binding protein
MRTRSPTNPAVQNARKRKKAMPENSFTIVGNLTADPELRFTPNGAGVSNFTIASTPRFLDKQSGEWKDGDPLYMRCNIWKEAAENVAESLARGTRVIATGKLKQRSYEKDGQKHTVVELEVEEIGPSLRFATAKVAKAGRAYNQPAPPAPADNPWGSDGPPF